jgi:hypothetical protein
MRERCGHMGFGWHAKREETERDARRVTCLQGKTGFNRLAEIHAPMEIAMDHANLVTRRIV